MPVFDAVPIPVLHAQVGSGAYKPQNLCPPGKHRHVTSEQLEVLSASSVSQHAEHRPHGRLRGRSLRCMLASDAPCSGSSHKGTSQALQRCRLQVDWFDFAPGLGDYMRGAASLQTAQPGALSRTQYPCPTAISDTMGSVPAGADLIISHAGAGSVFEAMALRRPVIAVPNAILMHNHQASASLTHDLLPKPLDDAQCHDQCTRAHDLVRCGCLADFLRLSSRCNRVAMLHPPDSTQAGQGLPPVGRDACGLRIECAALS